MTHVSSPGRAIVGAPRIETPEWVRDAVFYQIFPDRFASSERVVKPGPLEPWEAPPTHYGFKGGDLLGIAERLPYLQDLGVNALYLTPIFMSASNHRYHTYDYLRVDPLLGGDEALRELLDEAHARDIRVVLDGVFNHTGRGFWPFHHVLETGGDSPYIDWFHFDRDGLAAGHRLRAYPPFALEPQPPTDVPADGVRERRHGSRSLAHHGYVGWWDQPALPKLNTDHPAVREYIYRVAEHWLRFGIDGWRLDVPADIDDEAFWQEFRRRCKAVNPDAYLVGEIWHTAPEWLAGDRFDALMNYPLATAILGFAGGSQLDRGETAFHDQYKHVRQLDGPSFAARLDEILSSYDPAVTAVQLNLIDSHDTPRFVTMAGGDQDALRLATILQMTLPGAPCVYYGDEVGLEGGRDPDCRRAFPADPSSWDSALLAFMGDAIKLRREHPALRRGEYRALAAGSGAIAFSRSDDREWILIAINAGESPARLEIPLPRPRGRRVISLLPTSGGSGPGTSGLGIPADGNGQASLDVVIPARGSLVLAAE